MNWNVLDQTWTWTKSLKIQILMRSQVVILYFMYSCGQKSVIFLLSRSLTQNITDFCQHWTMDGPCCICAGAIHVSETCSGVVGAAEQGIVLGYLLYSVKVAAGLLKCKIWLELPERLWTTAEHAAELTDDNDDHSTPPNTCTMFV